jgi:hypothetical protein
MEHVMSCHFQGFSTLTLSALVALSTAPRATADLFAEIMATPASWTSPGHAFICISHTTASGIKEDCYGFYPSNKPEEAIVGSPQLANEFKKNPKRFGQVKWSLKKKITDQQYRDFQKLVDQVNTNTYNCTSERSSPPDAVAWRRRL